MKMKLCVFKQIILARLNGADLCALERLAILRSWGVEIDIVALLPSVWKSGTREFLESESLQYSEATNGQLWDSYEIEGIKVDLVYDDAISPETTESLAATEKVIASELSQRKPDLIWSHYTDFVISAALLKVAAKKLWLDISDNEYPRLEKLKAFPPLGEIYPKIENLMVASPFMKREVAKDFPNVKIHDWPNPMTSVSEVSQVLDSKKAWIFVNPTEVKGLSFVLSLAAHLPQEKFIFVGNWMTDAPKNLPPNIEYRGRQPKLDSIWAEAKGLLMPSQWAEAFGRIPLEAMANRVPVIASDRGALPETVSDGGLVLPLDLTRWVEALQRMNEDAMRWKEKGLSRWRRYQSETAAHYEKLRRDFFDGSNMSGMLK